MRKRKIRTLFILLFMSAIIFVGCSFRRNEGNDNYYIEEGQEKIYPNMKASEIKTILDKKESYSEKEGCAGAKCIKVYGYKDFEIWTYNDNDIEKVLKVIVKGNKVKTKSGLTIGDSKEKVKKLYGDDFLDDDGNMKYEKQKLNITVKISDDKVIQIEYSSKRAE